ncbi:MAG: alpha-glucan phosphorylase, partial [Dehalococcoidia bacterium]|nr:alpha-glucan phosphorylase [Dehalococcoidia bacterium]
MTTAPPGSIAYFSMEIGVDPSLPTYSGGLGVLAGDTLRAAADAGAPIVAMTLLHRKGYFRQHLDSRGNQTESSPEWSPEQYLEPIEPRVVVLIEGRPVLVRAWRYTVRGITGRTVPVYFLDTTLSENLAWDQGLTAALYSGDAFYRLCQETVLGIGGISMLRALGHKNIQAYHMNEGHSALLTIALLKEQIQGIGQRSPSRDDVEGVREQCVFTTHTPVAAGHDQFPSRQVRQVLGVETAELMEKAGCFVDDTLTMTHLALSFSRYVNGVSMRHEQVSRGMFPDFPISSITNGVHAVTWTHKHFQDLYDRYFPQWRKDNMYLRSAVSLPLEEVQETHSRVKKDLLLEVAKRSGVTLDPAAFTIGFARRATAYKRADLLFSNIDRLKRIVREAGPIQVILGGKAHYRDEGGKEVIRRVFQAAEALRNVFPVIYLEEYDMALAKLVCSGTDLWLNTPQQPHEASGTSGMKAAMNGVPSLSVLDGWWIEGHVEGVTGWSIGSSWNPEGTTEDESRSLYDKLEFLIAPMFYS